jgi:hypothetical protein
MSGYFKRPSTRDDRALRRMVAKEKRNQNKKLPTIIVIYADQDSSN